MEKRNTPHPKPEYFKQYFVDAGFTDIDVVEKFIDIGGWNKGLQIIFLPAQVGLMWLDKERAEIGRAAAETFGNGVPALVENLNEFIPDDEERKAFGERVVEEFKNGKYHFSFRTYGICFITFDWQQIHDNWP